MSSSSNLVSSYCPATKRSTVLESESFLVRDVWAENLDSEMKLIRDIMDDYPYIAMDTEFPGDVSSMGDANAKDPEVRYRSLEVNVNPTKLIQLGLTFSDDKGNLPTCGTDKFCIWQFNFKEFDPDVDVHQKDSIKLLREKSGIDFAKNKEKGVSAVEFSKQLMTSGVVMNSDVHWLTFNSGHDCGYLLKLLTGENLPSTPIEFFNLVRVFFPVLYDIKHLVSFTNSLHGGLNMVADLLGVKRIIGVAHQAGSDSLLTCHTFMKLRDTYFAEEEKLKRGLGVLCL